MSIPNIPDMPGLKTQEIDSTAFDRLPSERVKDMFLTGEMMRPGFIPFTVKVEYTMYPPGTGLNSKFEYIITSFPKEVSMLWATLIFPLEDLDKVVSIATEFGLFLSPPDVVPHAIGASGVEVFPLKAHENVRFIQGKMEDELQLKTVTEYWKDVIEKHGKGIPWKV